MICPNECVHTCVCIKVDYCTLSMIRPHWSLQMNPESVTWPHWKVYNLHLQCCHGWSKQVCAHLCVHQNRLIYIVHDHTPTDHSRYFPRSCKKASPCLAPTSTWSTTAVRQLAICHWCASRWHQTQFPGRCAWFTCERRWRGWCWRECLKLTPTSSMPLPGTDSTPTSRRCMALSLPEVRLFWGIERHKMPLLFHWCLKLLTQLFVLCIFTSCASPKLSKWFPL